MGLSVGGIGSGLDVDGIVSQLMTFERRPLNNLNALENSLKGQLSSYGRLKSSLSAFQDSMGSLSSISKFQIHSTTSSDENTFTATAASNAAPGSYAIQVERLAEAHKLATTGVDYAGQTGTFTVNVGATSFDVTIDATNNTLEGIRDAINSAAGNDVVTATTVNADAGTELILTANSTGADNAITFTAGTLDPLADIGLQSQNGLTTAGDPASFAAANLNAEVLIDGFSVTSSSNVVSDALNGVTLNLVSADVGVQKTLTVSKDNEAVTASVQSFVDSYNSLRSTIRSLGAKGGELQGDSGLLSIERSLQSIFNVSPTGLDYSNLTDVGITTNEDGSLSLDSTVLDEKLTTNFSGVADLFANDNQGYAFRFDALADSLLQADGLIDGREESLNSRISGVNDRQEAMEYRMDLIEKRLRKQFSALDTLIVQMNSTGSFLSQQLALLPGASKQG